MPKAHFKMPSVKRAVQKDPIVEKAIDNLLRDMDILTLAELGAQVMDDEQFPYEKRVEYAARIFASMIDEAQQQRKQA